MIYVSLDTFHKGVHNVTNELDAWLTFLSSDDPERMISLVQAYPHFKELYQDLIQFRKSPEELIFMISEALRIMDRNTERLMIDEWRQELAELQEAQQQAQQQLAEKDNTIAERDNTIAEQKSSHCGITKKAGRKVNISVILKSVNPDTLCSTKCNKLALATSYILCYIFFYLN